MKNIEMYIENLRKYIENNPDTTKDELIRYVYIDLGKRLSFNMLFTPFGNSKERARIYDEVRDSEKVDKCLETNVIICNSCSKILCLVLKPFGVDIRMAKDPDDIIKTPHVYNIVRNPDGSEYKIDLQEDMCHIQMHARTPNYGISVNGDERIISYLEQERIDRKIGYISDSDYYTDDYLYTLKMDVECMDTLYDKLKHILGNIEIFENPEACHIVRQWYHVSVLEYFFNSMIFDYRNSSGKIRVINCYKNMRDGSVIYVNCVVLEDGGETHIFLYNKSKYCYEEIGIDEFILEMTNGLELRHQKIGVVERRLRKIRNEDVQA